MLLRQIVNSCHDQPRPQVEFATKSVGMKDGRQVKVQRYRVRPAWSAGEGGSFPAHLLRVMSPEFQVSLWRCLSALGHWLDFTLFWLCYVQCVSLADNGSHCKFTERFAQHQQVAHSYESCWGGEFERLR